MRFGPDCMHHHAARGQQRVIPRTVPASAVWGRKVVQPHAMQLFRWVRKRSIANCVRIA